MRTSDIGLGGGVIERHAAARSSIRLECRVRGPHLRIGRGDGQQAGQLVLLNGGSVAGDAQVEVVNPQLLRVDVLHTEQVRGGEHHALREAFLVALKGGERISTRIHREGRIRAITLQIGTLESDAIQTHHGTGLWNYYTKIMTGKQVGDGFNTDSFSSTMFLSFAKRYAMKSTCAPL